MKKLKLFQLNRRVRKLYITTNLACCQRFSNNSEPKFTDIEVAVIYLYGMMLGFHKKISVYNFAREHLKKFCEQLPTYKQFCLRVNKLAPFFAEFCNAELRAKQKTSKTHLADSMPVVVAKGNRSSRAKTANEICDKGYCASKKMWYYGVKIHILSEEREHSVPVPRKIVITKASEHDLNAGKILFENAEDIDVFADKAYIDDHWGYDLQLNFVNLNTPFKERSKNQIPLDDGERAWNAMVASRRQMIESLFSQISRVTDIQCANFVRSLDGLFAFIWAKLAVMALCHW
jgi:hypothetical protein